MEGETDDCLTLKAELLPTGSVSFGRFELESLSWERRSSFSHNRYLEEVEKYSTPGSVTQKKAYFEAHFKKKALLHQASSETHNGSDSHNSENDIEDHVSNMEEFTGHGGNTRQETFVWNNETRGSVNVQDPDVIESTEGLQFSWYDESPPDASDEDEFDVTESKGHIQVAHYAEEQEVSDEHQDHVIDFKQEINNLPSVFPTKSMHCPVELVEKGEVVQSQCGNTVIESKKDDLHEVIGEPKTENGSVDVDDLPEKCVSPHSSLAEKDIQPCLKRTQKGSRSVRETVEQKSLKAKLRSTIVVAQSTRKTASEQNSLSSVKTFTRTLKKTERVLGTKTEKQAFINVPSSTCSDTKVSNPQVSQNLKAQVRQGIRSEKGLGEKKGDSCIQSICRDGENIVRQPEERPKKVVCSAMANANQINAAFKFRSDERAEKRKEYFVRLEEKLHAKEAQINEIQTRTQVQAEAEMKQLRRSLNFKATPMPSFYHEAVPRVSDGRKMLVPRKPRIKSTSHGDRTAADQANSEAIAGLASSEPAGSNNVPPDSKHEPSTTSDSVSRSVKKNGSDIRAQRGRVVVQKQQAERKAKKEVRVSSSSIRVTRVGVSKEMHDALDGSLAVDVAS